MITTLPDYATHDLFPREIAALQRGLAKLKADQAPDYDLSPRQRNSKSKVKGAYFNKRYGYFDVYVMYNGKRYYAGHCTEPRKTAVKMQEKKLAEEKAKHEEQARFEG